MGSDLQARFFMQGCYKFLCYWKNCGFCAMPDGFCAKLAFSGHHFEVVKWCSFVCRLKKCVLFFFFSWTHSSGTRGFVYRTDKTLWEVFISFNHIQILKCGLPWHWLIRSDYTIVVLYFNDEKNSQFVCLQASPTWSRVEQPKLAHKFILGP